MVVVAHPERTSPPPREVGRGESRSGNRASWWGGSPEWASRTGAPQLIGEKNILGGTLERQYRLVSPATHPHRGRRRLWGGEAEGAAHRWQRARSATAAMAWAWARRRKKANVRRLRDPPACVCRYTRGHASRCAGPPGTRSLGGKEGGGSHDPSRGESGPGPHSPTHTKTPRGGPASWLLKRLPAGKKAAGGKAQTLSHPPVGRCHSAPNPVAAIRERVCGKGIRRWLSIGRPSTDIGAPSALTIGLRGHGHQTLPSRHRDGR